ncbi:MAG: hypothetical protein ACK4F6_09045 [Hylemonella sp.]
MKDKKSSRGSSSSTTHGHKPAIAYRTEASATENLLAKVKILQDVVGGRRSRKETQSLYGELPTSVRQFNNWVSAPPGHLVIRSNSNDTLRKPKHKDILSSLQQLLEKCKEQDIPPSVDKKTERLASLRRTLAIEKVMREVCEREVARLKEQTRALEREVTILEASIVSMKEEFRSRIDQMTASAGGLRQQRDVVLPGGSARKGLPNVRKI